MKFSGSVKFEDSLCCLTLKNKKRKLFIFVSIVLCVLIIPDLFKDKPAYIFNIVFIILMYLFIALVWKYQIRSLKRNYDCSTKEYEAEISETGIILKFSEATTVMEWKYLTCFEQRNNVIDLYKEDYEILSIADYMLYDLKDWDKLLSLTKENVKKKH